MVESTALNMMSDKLELAEDLITLNDEFKKNVAIPYFKDIYKDLITQSDEKNKGINKVSILNVSQQTLSVKNKRRSLKLCSTLAFPASSENASQL